MKRLLNVRFILFVALISYVPVYAQDNPGNEAFRISTNMKFSSFVPDSIGDTILGKVIFARMDQALWNARSLRFHCIQDQESHKEDRYWKNQKTYSVWLKKDNLARVEIRDSIFQDEGTNIIYDGKNLWSYFIGENLTIYLDKNTVLTKHKNRYLTRDISEGASLSHDIMNYGTSVGMPVLYLSKFFGYRSALEVENIKTGYMGTDTLSGIPVHHIMVVMMDGQRISEYWISVSDYLPLKMQEKLSMNASNYFFKQEQWKDISVNEDLPDSLFRWEPPENWIEYELPSNELLEDILAGKKECLFDTFKNLRLIGGDTFDLENCKGKYTLLVFWRLGCPPCRKELPSLQRLYEKYKPYGLNIVGFNHVDNEDLVSGFLKKYEITFPNILDPSPGAKKLYDEFRTNIVPLNCLIDPEGYLFDQWYGFDAKSNVLEETIEALLKTKFNEGTANSR